MIYYSFATSGAAIKARDLALEQRRNAVSANRSRRLQNLPPIPLPPMPDRVLVPVAYDADGGYVGRLNDPADAEPGMIVKYEEAAT
jgi:hypothetical protein